jgi:RNA polymerase primary sigma factor
MASELLAAVSFGLGRDPDALDPEESENTEESEETEGPEIKATVIEHYDDAVKLYLRDIQKLKLLTRDEEKELAARIDLGDKAARDRMIVTNLRLVVKMAKRYMNRGLPFLDLIEEGNLGLIKAVDRFKLSKECRFSTYASWWIRQSMERALENQSRTIRLPVHVSDQIGKMIRASRELMRKLNREPTDREVADCLELEVSQVCRLQVLLKRTYSIEQTMGDTEFTLGDTIEDTTNVSPIDLIEDLNKFELVTRWLETLSGTEKRILILRFGLHDKAPQTLDTIGKSMGVTRERIRQIEVKALGKLRELFEAGDPSMPAELAVQEEMST